MNANKQHPLTLLSVAKRCSEYGMSEISIEISNFDDMFVPGQLNDYISIGRSAICIIANAMIASGRERVHSVLDLPCGGGRVTRHLLKFFSDAKLFVADIDKNKEAFVVEKFHATPIPTTADFSSAAPQKFDLIFVGSLVTHFGQNQFARAVNWFIDSLAPDGLLVMTTHGRRTAFIFRDFFATPARIQSRDDYLITGFGYQPDKDSMEPDGPQSYGGSLSSPSWVMRLVEPNKSVRIISFQEAAWADNHDVLVLQKRSIEL